MRILRKELKVMKKTCWSCEHWLIGLGCARADVKNCILTEHHHTCSG